MTVRVTIEGMSCGGCVRSVEHALSSVSEIGSRTVTVGEAVVTLVKEDEATIEKLRHAIEDAGFDVTAIAPAS